MPAEEDYESVLRSVQALIRAHPAMTALVVHNDAALAWVSSCLRASGRKVPGDVAVVAICPDELAEQVSPPLTSVRLPVEELGRHAVELLVGKLEGRAVPPLLLLPPRLSRRVSTPELASARLGAASSG
jgi:DNA-binding LacI/PurR family transcriptional regulator